MAGGEGLRRSEYAVATGHGYSRACVTRSDFGSATENGSTTLAVQGSDDGKKSTNNCQYCAARPCRGKDNGGTKKACLVFNAQKPIPASASDNERNFVFQCRACEGSNVTEVIQALRKSSVTEWSPCRPHV